MLDFTCAYYYYVLAKVVPSVEINNHVAVYRPDIIDITQNRLAHHVLPVDIVVHIFH